MKLWGKCVPILAGAALVFAAHATPARAQATGTITGTVVDATSGQTLESAQVYIQALNMGGLTNRQGRFLILNVPTGTHEVRAELIGYSSGTETATVTAGETTTVEFRLNSTALRLQELVVTGVAGETPRVKLPFTVDKVNVADMPVPSPSADGLLQGKVAGVKVVRGSGKPGDDASIMLRGPTTITGSQSPLIIVDGVITDNTLADVDALDVESIEVVKGAAAASLYGSRAANGVVQIQTKRGAGLAVDEARVIVRNEYGGQNLEGRIGLSNAHPYKTAGSAYVTCDGQQFQWEDMYDQGSLVCLDGFDGTQDPARAFQDNAYVGQTFDILDQVFDPGTFYSNYIAVEGKSGTTNYRASFSNNREQGIVDGHNGFRRKGFRLNLDHAVWDNLDLSLNTYYVQSKQDEIFSGPFFSLTFLPPNSNLRALDEDGTLRIGADPLSLEENPLYEVENRETTDNRNRFMASVYARYSPASWLDFEADYSIERYNFNRRDFLPKGFKQLEQDPLDGELFLNDHLENDINTSLTASINYAFGDLTTRTKLRYLLEDQHTEAFSAEGQDFAVADVPVLSNLDRSQTSISSSLSDIISEGYFFITAFDYQGKYVGDVMVRRDGSSLFGPEERWQTYYRGSAAWRLSQEDWWPVDALDEFKLRYSYGTAGDRPRFSAQYETYSVSQGVITPVNLGNRNLKPASAVEQEFGLDMVFYNRYAVSFAYADTKVEDQILQVPLPGFAGFRNQWRNAGTLESEAFEASLEASLIEGPDMSWSARVNFDRIRQEITELNVAPYQSSFFWIRAGEPLGAFYGSRWATSCDELHPSANCGDFQLNDDGYLVYVGSGNSFKDGISQSLWGTNAESGTESYDWGMPVRSVECDASGEECDDFLRLGNTTPDFTLSWSSNFRWKNLSLYALFDMEHGADIYNQTAQWALREWRHADADQTGKPDELKKPVAYYSVLYNVNDFSSHFVEDGSYLKLRELSLRYALDSDQLASLFGGQALGLERATINLVGRNLKTWTDFGGYDPEVGQASGGSDAIGRLDNYQYPNFRTITASLELIF